jgi:hypothetical protein
MSQFTPNTRPAPGVLSFEEWQRQKRKPRREREPEEEPAPRRAREDERPYREREPEYVDEEEYDDYDDEPRAPQPKGRSRRRGTQTRRRAIRRVSTYESGKRILATGLLMLGCAGMWLVGAKFTVDALYMAFGNLWGYGIAYWIIPVGLTAYEMAYIPIIKTRDALRTWLWLFIAGFDVGTTVYGMQPWLATQPIGQWSLPVSSVTVGEWMLVINGAWVLAAILGSIFALASEPLAHRLWETR